MAEKTGTSNAEKAIAFLKAFRGKGYINVSAIHPQSGEVNGITRNSTDPYLQKFIEANEGTCNLYFMVNEPGEEMCSVKGKLKKEHVNKIHGLYIDADPNKDKEFIDERIRLNHFAEQLKNEQNPPTYIVDSGGGIQAFWLFNKPIEATDANVKHCEGLSRALAIKYDTDKVQNIDRIMRLPFTTNIPTEKKKKLGRKTARASVIHAASPRGHRYHKFDHIEPVHAEEKENDVEGYDMSKLHDRPQPSLIAKLQKDCERYERINNLWNGTFMKNEDRSDWDFALTDELKSLGYSLDEVAQLLWVFPHGKGKEQTGREIARTYARAAEDFMDLTNEIDDKANPLSKELEPPKDGELPKRLQAIDAYSAEWVSDSKPLIKKLMEQCSIIVLYGQSNTGKSFVATDFAGHIATGKDWGEFKTPKQMGVLYICAEAGKSYSRRIAALRQRLEVEKNCGLNGFPYQYVAMGVNFLTNKDDIRDVVLLAKQQERITGIKVGLIVVDTLATTFSGGNENSSEDMGLFIENMKYIQEHADTAVLVVHHSGKDVAAGARGHSSLRAATDTEFEITSIKKGEKYDRKIKTKKQRDGESDTEIGFTLNVVTLGLDEDNDPITTCHVVLPSDDAFDNLAPSLLDGLSDGELAAYKAINLMNLAIANPESNLPKGFTNVQLVTILHHNILKNDGFMLNDDGILDTSQVSAMAKPNETQLRLFRTHRTSLVDKDILTESEVDQYVRK